MTPIGVVWGLVEAWRFHWWLAVLMAVLVGVIGLFTWMTVKRIRDEFLARTGFPRDQHGRVRLG